MTKDVDTLMFEINLRGGLAAAFADGLEVDLSADPKLALAWRKARDAYHEFTFCAQDVVDELNKRGGDVQL